MPLTQQELEELLREGEGPRVEFKHNVGQAGMLARLIGAFANSGGGTILIGVEEPNRVVGTDVDRVRTLLGRELARLNPAPPTTLETVDVAGKTVAAIRVPGLDRPVFSEGGAYARIGATTRPMTAADLAYALQREPESDRIGRLAEAVSIQTVTIEQLRRDSAAALSWRSKLIDYLIGGIIGAILGALFTIIAG